MSKGNGCGCLFLVCLALGGFVYLRDKVDKENERARRAQNPVAVVATQKVEYSNQTSLVKKVENSLMSSNDLSQAGQTNEVDKSPLYIPLPETNKTEIANQVSENKTNAPALSKVNPAKFPKSGLVSLEGFIRGSKHHSILAYYNANLFPVPITIIDFIDENDGRKYHLAYVAPTSFDAGRAKIKCRIYPNGKASFKELLEGSRYDELKAPQDFVEIDGLALRGGVSYIREELK